MLMCFGVTVTLSPHRGFSDQIESDDLSPRGSQLSVLHFHLEISVICMMQYHGIWQSPEILLAVVLVLQLERADNPNEPMQMI
jgi:hypothetical protein